jgi:hypothetical protein
VARKSASSSSEGLVSLVGSEDTGGKTWRNVLEEALQNMRCMVVLWSANSINSEWVKEEAEEGKTQRKLVPILIESVKPPMGFRTIQAADLIGWNGNNNLPGLQQLLADLRKTIHHPGSG